MEYARFYVHILFVFITNTHTAYEIDIGGARELRLYCLTVCLYIRLNSGWDGEHFKHRPTCPYVLHR